MIGLVSSEDYTALEFRPIFASNKMQWAKIVINKPLPEKYWGEWGLAFTKQKRICIFKGLEMTFKNIPFFNRPSGITER